MKENLAPHHFTKKRLQPVRTATIRTKLNYRCSIIESPFSITARARILRLLSMEPKFFAHWRGNRRIPEDREGQRNKHLSGSAETSSNSNKESRRVASNEIPTRWENRSWCTLVKYEDTSCHPYACQSDFDYPVSRRQFCPSIPYRSVLDICTDGASLQRFN